jgi:rod shape-determining protein MreC
VTVQPSGQRGLIVGDNTLAPPIDFVENRDLIRPGDRVVSSGDGDVFPSGVLIGHIAVDTGGRMRVRLAADYKRLEFLRILRNYGTERISDPGRMVLPEVLPETAATEAAAND